jgi:hypothetical protein
LGSQAPSCSQRAHQRHRHLRRICRPRSRPSLLPSEARARYAPAELSEAHTQLALADSAVTERKMVLAEHFADQSRAEAELASAKTSAAKANSVNDEMKRSNGTLAEEMKRTSGDKP